MEKMTIKVHREDKKVYVLCLYHAYTAGNEHYNDNLILGVYETLVEAKKAKDDYDVQIKKIAGEDEEWHVEIMDYELRKIHRWV